MVFGKHSTMGEKIMEVKMPFISVIIPSYNAETTVVETLESLERQTFKDFEVICINDGSSDKTLELIEAFKSGSPLSVRIFTQENAGVSVARNRGIDEATGTILMFLDADDKYRSNFFQEIFDWTQKGFDTIYGGKTIVDDDFEKPVVMKSKERSRQQTMDGFMYNKGKYHFSLFSYQRDIVDKYAIRFTPGARYGEDWEFATKVLDHCEHNLELMYPVMFRRIIETSAMHKVSYNHVDAVQSAIRTENWLSEHNSDYYETFAAYMRHRAIFSVLHMFAKNQAKDLFDRFIREYDIKPSMKALMKNKKVENSVKLAAASYLVSPWIYYNITGKW